jgi:hypothetical protein
VAKDDASVTSTEEEVTSAAGDISASSNGLTILDVATILQGINGASASIVTEGSGAGLTLLAQLDQLATYSVTATNFADSAQSYSYSVTFNGASLQIPSITGSISLSLSNFQSVPGGFFLPFSKMPGNDLTALLPAGDIEFDDIATVTVAPVPEPNSLVLLGCSLLGLLFFVKHHRLSLRSLGCWAAWCLIAIGTLCVSPGSSHAQASGSKKNEFVGSYAGNLVGEDASITWFDTGISKNPFCDLSAKNNNPISAMLGTGLKGSAPKRRIPLSQVGQYVV